MLFAIYLLENAPQGTGRGTAESAAWLRRARPWRR